MSEYLEAVILGIVQGLTEFLPVSSSGHLEIAKFIFGENWVAEESLLLTIVLHFATALSTIVVFWRDIVEITVGFFKKEGILYRKFVMYIIISLIPAGIIGILFQDYITTFFVDNLLLVSCMLLVTAVLLYVADIMKDNMKEVNGMSAFLIGLAQAIAIIPGISRSGSTIATALLLRIDRSKATRFSFLMVLPLIIGKMILDIGDGTLQNSSMNGMALALGFLAAFVSGVIACKWMIIIVKRANLKYFSFYCLAVGIIGISYVLFFT